MNILMVQKILGLLLMLFSLTMLPALVVSLLYADGAWRPFSYSFAATLLAGLLAWLPTKGKEKELRLRDGFLVVASFWVVLGLFGALPFYISERPQMDITDAIFESMSGLTTTGATVISGLDSLPESILYYRQQIQWLGGMGIIVLAVAVLPMLGVGGMQLYRAETPGPIKDTKLTPRITETAKALWVVYLVITIICAVSFWLAGMSVFDAVGHSFSTVAIGGFSTHDASIGYFQSNTIEMITIFFMFIAGLNFSLHFLAWKQMRISHYFQDPESRAYGFLLLVLAVGTVVYLFWIGTYTEFPDAFVKGLFHVVSIGTTTGFATADYAGSWPAAVPVVLILASFVGGCAGSTGGGMKVIRWLLIYKQGTREVMRLVHPNAEIPVKLGSRAVQPRVIDAVWGFFAIYIVVFGMMMIILILTGLDQVTAFATVAACLNNLGPGLGETANNYAGINDTAKFICVFAMLLGRLEIFTLIVLLTPVFWRN